MKFKNKWKAVLLLSSVFTTTHLQSAFADQLVDSKPFFDAPYSFTNFNGGNCVWLAWEMAYEKWGIQLPHVGDARLWTALDGQTVQQGEWQYTLKLSDKPVRNSLVIFQPSDLDTVAGGAFNGDFYGHVAWVSDIPNPNEIHVVESSVNPPSDGMKWHGCWWREQYYQIVNLKTIKFLYIEKAINTRTHTTLTSPDVLVKQDNNEIYQFESLNKDKVYFSFDSNKYIYIQDITNPLIFHRQYVAQNESLSLSTNKSWQVQEQNGKLLAFYQKTSPSQLLNIQFLEQ
ncbi:CHAP domain-containing protein (plasmid) [Aneurinibacillus sp. Ricciae_BoGa-3]|uniref:CHAP domain-containing protein n=1 Tax=Aneurinibacillus sp. Ricciae_BoGa-3 TaxID=3022697 RepID=UPI0023400DD3|nr:CHAP domain-containing protein [Aneurinibacillus sp. Ricciae_BoGa-3]WCK57582.1 CHAP domain-containing protein [Aneurinibacillus sp. Ricciae_BoGa-3]